MTRYLTLAVLSLVLLAVLAERERRADLEKMQTQPIPPVHPALVWPPGDAAPAMHVCPAGAEPQPMVVTVKMELEEMP